MAFKRRLSSVLFGGPPSPEPLLSLAVSVLVVVIPSTVDLFRLWFLRSCCFVSFAEQ